MPLPRLARLAALGATLVLVGLGCSEDDKRDQFYGTDVGANWIPPDATVREDAAGDGGVTDAAQDGGVTDAGGTAADGGADASDGGSSADAPASDTL